MISIVSAQESLALVDVHGDAALSNDAGLIAHVLQSIVKYVGELAPVVLFRTLNTKIGCRNNILSLGS